MSGSDSGSVDLIFFSDLLQPEVGVLKKLRDKNTGVSLGEVGSVSLGDIEGAAAYLRRLLGQRMTLRSVPQLHFKRDYSIEQGARLSSLIDAAVRGDHADNDDSDPDT